MKNSTIKRLIIYSLFVTGIGAWGLTSEANNANAQEAKVQVIRNLDEPALNPYQQTEDQTCTLAGNCALNFTAVPSGKRLVIQSVSVSFSANSNPLSARAWLGSLGGSKAVHSLPVISQGNNTFSVNQTVQRYYEAGQTPRIDLFLDGASYTSIQQFTISGYTVNLP